MSCDAAIKNIWSAMPTPFCDDGSLDVKSLERMTEQHRALGVTGLFLCGSCGEGPFMPSHQRTELVRAMRRIAGEEMHLAVQVSDTSAARVLVNMQEAADAGADSVVIAPPIFMRFANDAFLRRYFFEPMERFDALPIGIYVLKQPADSALGLALWQEIVDHPAAAFAKDSSGDAEYARAFAAKKAARPELRLMTGNEFDVIATMREGYDGCLLGTAVLNAGMIRRVLDALACGDDTGARAWQDRSNAFLKDLFRPDISAWMSGLKYALCRLGMFESAFSHFAYPLDDADRARIDAALAREEEWIRA